MKMSKKVKEIELRHRELQNEQDAREHELKLKEHEEREREREHELKLKEHAEREREHAGREREREREHELELKRIELEMSKQGIEPGNLNVGQDRAKYVRAPQAPAFRFNSFNEKTDDLDSWFATFESQCEIFEVSDTDKKAHLIGLFSGKYRDTLTYFADKEYTFIRDKMLRTYNLTTDGYRRKFFGLVPVEDETIHAFQNRVESCFDKWISLAKINKDYEALKDLIIYHQILESCNPEFTKFVLLHKAMSTKELADKAENFFQANPNQQLAGIQEKFLSSNAAAYNQKFENRGKGFFRGQYRFGGVPGRGNSGFGRGTGKKYDSSDQSDKFIQCFYCKEWGHRVADCPKQSKWCEVCKKKGDHKTGDCSHFKEIMELLEKKNSSSPGKVASTFSDNCTTPSNQGFSQMSAWKDQHIYQGNMKHNQVNKSISILRDTGSAVHAVHESLISSADLVGSSQKVITFGGKEESFDLAKIQVDTPFISGSIVACVLRNYPEKFRYFDVLIGNGGVLDSPVTLDPSPDIVNDWYNRQKEDDGQRAVPCYQVMTRASYKKQPSDNPLSSSCLDFNISHSELASLQHKDPSLSKYFDLIGDHLKTAKSSKSISKWSFELRNCVLVRIFSCEGQEKVQIMVPNVLRPKILSVAHDNPFSGHMGTRRTFYRLTQSFYWPGVSSDVTKYCQSCAVCLKTKPKGKTPKAPLQISPVFDRPFFKCAIDLIGPLPTSAAKNRYVLTFIDYTTRWVEAAALKDTTTPFICEELISWFARFGFPSILLSDGGPQFTSKQMEEILLKLGISHSVSTPYHPQSNGLCERANATIKSMIRKLSSDNPSSWDKLLQCALFAYREVPQETTGFSPFEMVYGSSPRGPLALLRDIWLSPNKAENSQPAFEFVEQLRKRIAYSCQLANERTESQMEISKARYDIKSKNRSFTVGDKVLLLLSESASKFSSSWKGPFEIVQVVPNSNVNYVVRINGQDKTFHVDMLQKFVSRPEYLVPETINGNDKEGKKSTGDTLQASAAIVMGASSEALVNSFSPALASMIHEEHDSVGSEDTSGLTNIIIPSLKQTETIYDIKTYDSLNQEQTNDVKRLLESYSKIFSDVPSRTECITHNIKLSSSTPVRRKPYPLPFTSEQIVRDEVNSMIANDIIEPSDSPYSSPIVLVKKRDGSVRFCIDFRALNAITVGDACPIPDHDAIMSKMCTARYFTKLDLTKGYWQIGIENDSRAYTAFQAAGELFQFKRMAFGLKNAPMTFNRMMNRLLGQREDVVFFFDDVTIFHEQWDNHLAALKVVFEIFLLNNLRVKPSKTEIGFPEIQFLGHRVGRGLLKPIEENVGKILSLQVPKTKKQVRSIIGLVNFYAKFIVHISDLLFPLYDLTKKGRPERVVWTDQCQRCLEKIQVMISSEPALVIPNVDHLFYVQTDASGTGLGCVLLQEVEGILRPCRFHSRKLLPRETRYAVVEREALAIVWGVQKLARFLLGAKFILQTDHAPLRCLINGEAQNARLCRWSLILQQFNFEVHYIRGTNNSVADFLSRNC